jgi:Arc/MetJ-type ribon-helix-helix transcriptional regulator
MATVSIKLTPEQEAALTRHVKRRGFPSKAEFLRFAIMRAMEDELSVATLDEIFRAREQVRRGRTVSLKTLLKE